MTLPKYTPGPADWRYLDQAGATELWSELAPWVQWMRARYDLGSRHILGCWFRHPALVEELTAAMYAHREVYQLQKKNLYHGGLSAWHYQVLWPLVARLGTVTSFNDCRSGVCSYLPSPAPTDSDLAEFIAADVDARPHHAPVDDSAADTTGESPSTLTMDEVIEMIDRGTAVAEDPADDFSAVEILGARWEYDDDAEQYRQAHETP
ncbi:hypothetical protein [Rhodococcus sp. NPDC076796]|uniref:hypothetical protein n=1 Tax=Rhodococcus sp. NPDC076796 TaxID=3154859 RepID=UPI00344C3EF7